LQQAAFGEHFICDIMSVMKNVFSLLLVRPWVSKRREFN